MTKHIERLTRYEADIVVRQLTGRYYEKYGFDNGPLFEDFAAKLAWQVGGENTWDYSSYLFDVLTEMHSLAVVYGDNLSTELRDWHESELNVSVSNVLGAANIPGPMSLYYTQPVAA